MANINIKKISLTVLIILIILFIFIVANIYYWTYYWTVPIKVELIEIAKINTEEELSGTWWNIVSSEDNTSMKDYNITIPKNDFDESYLAISGGREIKKLTYNRISMKRLPWTYSIEQLLYIPGRGYVGEAVFGKQLHPNTIFVYKISKKVKLFQADIIIED